MNIRVKVWKTATQNTAYRAFWPISGSKPRFLGRCPISALVVSGMNAGGADFSASSPRPFWVVLVGLILLLVVGAAFLSLLRVVLQIVVVLRARVTRSGRTRSQK